MSDVKTKRAASCPNKAALEAASEEAYNTAMSWRDPTGMAGMISWRGADEELQQRTRAATWAAVQTYNAMTTPAPSPAEALPSHTSGAEVGGEIERLRAEIIRLTAERDQARSDYEQEADWSKTVDSHGLDGFDDLAKRWLKVDAIQRMHNAAASVFAKWSNDELMGRFKTHMTRIMHTAFVEGAIAGVRTALAKPASEPAGGGVSWIVHDWEYVSPHTGGRRYAGSPHVAEMLIADGVALTPVYVPLSSPASSSPAEAEALPAGVDAVREARAAAIRAMYHFADVARRKGNEFVASDDYAAADQGAVDAIYALAALSASAPAQEERDNG